MNLQSARLILSSLNHTSTSIGSRRVEDSESTGSFPLRQLSMPAKVIWIQRVSFQAGGDPVFTAEVARKLSNLTILRFCEIWLKKESETHF